jgi:hypothetical protein
VSCVELRFWFDDFLFVLFCYIRCTHAIAAFQTCGESWRDDDGEGGAGGCFVVV